jgi:hypothetical protein
MFGKPMARRLDETCQQPHLGDLLLNVPGIIRKHKPKSGVRVVATTDSRVYMKTVGGYFRTSRGA